MPSNQKAWPELKRILFLIAAVALSFLPVLSNNFVYWDDDAHLLENALATSKDWAAVPAIFQNVVNKTYIPLTILSFNIENRLFGLNPFFFHLDNLLLHIAVCLLLYRLIIRMGFDRNAALLAALFFGIHPMHVESVAWVTARKDVLYSLFYVLAMDSYWIYLNRPPNEPTRFVFGPRSGRYLAALGFGFLSILAKPMALSLPFILGLLDWYKNKKLTTKSATALIPFFVLIVPIAWLTYQLNSRVPNFDLGQSILLWSWTATFYIKKFLTPFVLIPLYQVPDPVSITNPSYASGLIVLAAMAILIWIGRKNRLWMFACAFYILSTFFLWRYDRAVDVTIVGDRFMYLPSAGFCLFFADALLKRPRFKWATVAIIVFFIVKTSAQCRVWQDDLSLWNYVIAKKQQVFQAYNSRAVALVKAKRRDEAMPDFNKALTLNPGYPRGYYNRGKVYADMGNLDLALADFDKAIELNKRDNKYYLERGIVRSKHGELDLAVGDFNAALDLDPRDAGAYNNRGIAHKKMGDLEAAVKDYTKAIELNPGSAQSYINRGNVWLQLGRRNEALADFRRAQSLGFPLDPALLK